MNSILKSFHVVVIIMMMLSMGAVSFAAMPEGSYKKSCANCTIVTRQEKNFNTVVDIQELVCQCKMKNGNNKETKMVFNYCKKDSISNDNGNLKCVNTLPPKNKPNPSSAASALKKVKEAKKNQ